MLHTYCESPLGDLLLVGDGAVVSAIHLPRERQRKDPDPAWMEDGSAFAVARRELGEYFAGQRESFGFAREQGGTGVHRVGAGAFWGGGVCVCGRAGHTPSPLPRRGFCPSPRGW